MISFEQEITDNAVEKLLSGQDYRKEVLNLINASFFDFTIDFFKDIVKAKIESENIDLDWYKEYFINDGNYSPAEAAIYAGVNKKSITNMHGSAAKSIVIEAANNNFEYLSNVIMELEKDALQGLAININITYKEITVGLSLTESLLVINALATKKLQLRGGAWSSIGKKVEKPLLDELCKTLGVPLENIDNSVFKKDKSKEIDREVDYKLIGRNKQEYRIEVKLMGKGNPESADATIARNSDIFVADTLSDAVRNQLTSMNIEYLELRGNSNDVIVSNFGRILEKLDVPFNKDLLSCDK